MFSDTYTLLDKIENSLSRKTPFDIRDIMKIREALGKGGDGPPC